MSLKIRVQGETIHFPGVCANCMKPATQKITVRAQRALSRHRESREVEVGYCDACYRLYRGETPFHDQVEAAVQRIPYLRATQYITGVVAFICGITGAVTGMEILAKNRPAWPWWTAGVCVVIFVVAAILLNRAQHISEAPLPSEEAEARRSVRILNFAGDITDFYFEHDDYAESFRRLNPLTGIIVAQ
jgi:hypothetical protein